jgi:hypothetical protein
MVQPNPFHLTQSHLLDFRVLDATFSNQCRYHQTEQNNLKTHFPIFLNITLLGLCAVACFIPEYIMMWATETFKMPPLLIAPNLQLKTLIRTKNKQSTAADCQNLIRP